VVDFPGRASTRVDWPAALQPCNAVVMVLDAAYVPSSITL